MHPLVRLRNLYYQRSSERRLRQIYQRFSKFTMIPEIDYINTLRLGESVKDIDGCVVECGVWKGGMGAGLVVVMENTRQFFLFDSFQGLPLARTIDGSAAIEWQANTSSPSYFDNCSA